MPSYLHCTCGVRTSFVYQSGVGPECSLCGTKAGEERKPMYALTDEDASGSPEVVKFSQVDDRVSLPARKTNKGYYIKDRKGRSVEVVRK